jgi:transposase
MDVPAIAKIAFTSEDRVREVIHNFNRDGFDSLAPQYAGGRRPKFSAAERAEVKKIALGRPADYGEPFWTWSLTKLADIRVRKGWLRTSATRDSGRFSVRRVSPFKPSRPGRSPTTPTSS